MNLIFLAIFAACACLVNAQLACRTSGNQQGECLTIYNCQPLLELVTKKDRTRQDVDLLKKSQCGYEKNSYAVCCPKPKAAKTCNTPEGNAGECISLFSCPHLKDMLKPPVPKENVAYVQRFRCEGLDDFSVCCGPPVNTPTKRKIIPSNCEDNINAFPPDPRSGCCGADGRFGNKIVGGNATAIDQYPWLVTIEYVNEGVTSLWCGGALISGKYVLTAGHCVAGSVLKVATPKRVRLGEYDVSNEGPDCVQVEAGGEDCTDGIISIDIEKTFPHPQYNPIDPKKWNDIALIRLKETAPFTDFIRPICLPTKDLTLPQNRPVNFLLFAAGWGAVGTRQPHSNVKLHVELPFVSQEKCKPAFSRLWKGQLCAGGQSGKDSCSGDSGGPLMYEGENTTEVVGIISFGRDPCATQGIPAVYSKVYEYLDWIRSTIVP